MQYPRVTEILHAFTNYDRVPEKILSSASARGTAVHALCAGIAKGAWIPDSMIQEDILGYVNSFKKWSEAQVAEFIIVEKRYAHETLEYTGQLDLVVKGLDNELYLVDLKTSSRPQKTYPLQMAAYDNLLKNNQITVKGAMLVYLNRNGEFPEIHFLEDMEEEFHVFLSALDCWNYLHKGKRHGKKRINSEEEPT